MVKVLYFTNSFIRHNLSNILARENFPQKTAKDAFNKSNNDDSLASLTTIYYTGSCCIMYPNLPIRSVTWNFGCSRLVLAVVTTGFILEHWGGRPPQPSSYFEKFSKDLRNFRHSPKIFITRRKTQNFSRFFINS